MNVTIVSDVFGEQNNGTTITIKRLIDGLEKRKHNVKVISTFNSSNDNFITLQRRNFGIFDKFINVKNGVELAKPNESKMIDVIKESDIVHIVLPFKTGVVASKICLRLGKPFTTAFHCPPEVISGQLGLQNFEPLNSYLYKRFYKKLYSKANRIHCPTLFIANQLKKHHYKKLNYVISNGVSDVFKKKLVDKPENLKDKFVVLYIARYSKGKKHKTLLDAVKYSKYRDKIHLILAGKGPEKDKLIKYVKKNKINATFGFYNSDELFDIINYSDLYVHPSEIEVESISCLEAIACGLVPGIYNSKKSATSQFALSYNNLFINSDSQDLSKKIDYWLENPQIKDKFSKKYVEFAKQFNIDKCIDKMIEMFKDEIEDFNNVKNKY